jgi:arylsulfatase A-like enzyme
MKNWISKAFMIFSMSLPCLNASEKKNVLFIAIDDLKPLLGCYDVDWIKSPNIDKIASEGTTFLNNHCQWAVCGPSRASIMLGMRPESTKVMNLKTDMRKVRPDAKSLPQVFKENGYETVARGKIYDPRCVPGGRNSDDPQSWTLPYAPPNGAAKSTKQVVDAPEISPDKLADGVILRQGIEALEKVSQSGKPFFLAIGFKKPHLPFEAPKPYWDMYNKEEIPMSPYTKRAKGAPNKYSYHTSKEPRTYGGVPKKGAFDEKLQKDMLHGYAACVSYIDDLVGRLVQALKDKDLYEDTIICIWGDHGFHLGDHDLWGKHTNLEQATRSPLIIRAPGYSPQQKTNSPTEFIDVFPTLLNLCGLDAPDTLEGKSLTPILKDPTASVQNGAISNFKSKGAMGYAYRTSRYRYMEWIHQKTGQILAKELYDYEKDPGEEVNLAEEAEYAELMTSLASSLREEAKGSVVIYKDK